MTVSNFPGFGINFSCFNVTCNQQTTCIMIEYNYFIWTIPMIYDITPTIIQVIADSIWKVKIDHFRADFSKAEYYLFFTKVTGEILSLEGTCKLEENIYNINYLICSIL